MTHSVGLQYSDLSLIEQNTFFDKVSKDLKGRRGDSFPGLQILMLWVCIWLQFSPQSDLGMRFNNLKLSFSRQKV